MNILAIGAHPDDIELGAGGLILKAARSGHNVYMMVITKGSASGDPEERAAEVMHSARFVGAKGVRIGNFIDSALTVGPQLISFIEEYMDQVSPDLILTHSSGDVHHDHRAVAAATVEAGRFYSNILSYEIPLTKNFDPKVFYDVSDVIDDKLRLLKIFWSQETKLYVNASVIRGLAQFRAFQSRLNSSIDHVEAFEVAKMCLDKDFKLMKVPFEKPLPNIGRVGHERDQHGIASFNNDHFVEP